MYRKVSLDYLKFVAIKNSNGIETTHTFGFKLHESQTEIFDNSFASFTILTEKINEKTIFDFIKSNADYRACFFKLIIATKGIYLNGVWINYNG